MKRAIFALWGFASLHPLSGRPGLNQSRHRRYALNDRMPRDWELVRSYTLKGGHLFLSLAADGGTYEFEPTAQVEAGKSTGSTTAMLENTHWKLTSLGGTPLTPDDWQQEPYLVLSSESRQVAG